MAWYRHGSEDSADVDVLVQVAALPAPRAILAFTQGVAEDRNLFVVTHGPLPSPPLCHSLPDSAAVQAWWPSATRASPTR